MSLPCHTPAIGITYTTLHTLVSAFISSPISHPSHVPIVSSIPTQFTLLQFKALLLSPITLKFCCLYPHHCLDPTGKLLCTLQSPFQVSSSVKPWPTSLLQANLAPCLPFCIHSGVIIIWVCVGPSTTPKGQDRSGFISKSPRSVGTPTARMGVLGQGDCGVKQGGRVRWQQHFLGLWGQMTPSLPDRPPSSSFKFHFQLRGPPHLCKFSTLQELLPDWLHLVKHEALSFKLRMSYLSMLLLPRQGFLGCSVVFS